MRFTALLAVLLTASFAFAAEPETREWTVDGIQREAIVVAPANAKTDPAPLVFAFHGHGGKIQGFAHNFAIDKAWPEAIVVYPQGLPTPGRLVDREGKLPGWQTLPGEQGDRDLKFFDAMLGSIEKDYKVDPKQIYVTGHSNGGTFTYVLWRARGEKFAAFAPIATAFPAFLQHPEAEVEIHDVALRPVFHIAGKNDPLVKIEWQQRTMDVVRKINKCDAEGKPWNDVATIYESSAAAPFIAWIHPGGHNIPDHAVEKIVKFFKQFPRPAANADAK
jgi:polyhydroxybutyrate depolymerase